MYMPYAPPKLMRFPAFVLIALGSFSAWAADGRLTFLSRQLSQASDPRARAQAALMLGATNDAQAVPPLCAGLADANELVRVSVTKALGQLADPSAVACFRSHGVDANPEVRDLIQKTLSLLEGQQTKPGALYVLLSPVVDKLDTPDPNAVKLAEEGLRAALAARGVVLAPPAETKAQALQVLHSRHLKGFVLNPELHTHPPGGVRMTLLVLTYPERSILGEVSVKARGAGMPALINALSPKILEEAADTFDWSR